MAHKINLANYSPDRQRDLIAGLIATGALTVTRCPEMVRSTSPALRHVKRGGGMLPRHLDPRVLERDHEPQEGEPYVSAKALSRKIRRAPA